MTTPMFVPYPPMLGHLHRLLESGELSELLVSDPTGWQSLSIDYHQPRVERLYRDLTPVAGRGALRVMLHRVHPCEPSKALWHSHPWPAAVAILDGTCEHSIGFVQGNAIHTAARVMQCTGSSYEMTDPLAWHAVRPVDAPTHSVMICGTPWKKHTAPRPAPQRPLTADEADDLLLTFGDLLVWNA